MLPAVWLAQHWIAPNRICPSTDFPSCITTTQAAFNRFNSDGGRGHPFLRNHHFNISWILRLWRAIQKEKGSIYSSSGPQRGLFASGGRLGPNWRGCESIPTTSPTPPRTELNSLPAPSSLLKPEHAMQPEERTVVTEPHIKVLKKDLH